MCNHISEAISKVLSVKLIFIENDEKKKFRKEKCNRIHAMKQKKKLLATSYVNNSVAVNRLDGNTRLQNSRALKCIIVEFIVSITQFM